MDKRFYSDKKIAFRISRRSVVRGRPVV